MPRITRHGGPSIYSVTPVKGARPDVVSVRVSTVDLVGGAGSLTDLVGPVPEDAEPQGDTATQPAVDDADTTTDDGASEESAEPEAAELPKPRKSRAARRTVGG